MFRVLVPSEVGFVLLDLDHQVVQVDELGAHGQAAERRLVQDLVEAVVVLDQLGQRPLQGRNSEGRKEGASTRRPGSSPG